MKPKQNVTLKKLKELLINPPENLYIKLYDDNKEVAVKVMKPKKKSKYTLSERLDRLEAIVIEGFKHVNTRLDRVEARLDHVEARLDRVEARLDRVETRLDHVEARLDHVEARLDYNNLKDLPKGA